MPKKEKEHESKHKSKHEQKCGVPGMTRIAPIKTLLRKGEKLDILYIQPIGSSSIRVYLKDLPSELKELFEENPSEKEIKVSGDWWVTTKGTEIKCSREKPSEVKKILKAQG